MKSTGRNALRCHLPQALPGCPAKWYLIAILSTVLLASTAAADPPAVDVNGPPAPSQSDRERICISRIFHGSHFTLQHKSMQWDASEDVLWWKRDNDDGQPEIVRLSVPDGEETVAVAADQFVLPSGERIAVNDYQWSPDGRYLLVFTNSVRVWRSETRGDYWLLDLLSKKWRKLGGDVATNQSLMFATFSPRSDAVAYVRDRGLYREDIASGEIQTIAASEDPHLIHGTFDWVYEEELSLRQGYQFSPDGKRIAFWFLDESDVPVHSLIDNTSERYPSVKRFAYPKVGQTNAAARIGVFDLQTGKTTWMNIQGDPRQHYLAAMQWLPKDFAGANDRLLIQQLPRRQNENRLWLCDAVSGDSIVLLTETSPGWVMHQAEIHPLPTQQHNPADETTRPTADFLWLSERTGWQHLYRLAIQPQLLTEKIDASEPTGESGIHRGVSLDSLTSGEWDVIALDAVNRKTGQIYFTAAPTNAATRALYACPSNSESPLEQPLRISPTTNGTYQYRLSDSADFALQTWSDFDTPPVQQLVQLNPYKTIETFIDNAKAKAAIDDLKPIEQQFVSLPIDEQTALDAWIMLPKRDAGSGEVEKTSAHRIPLILYVYGEPAGQTVRDAYGGNTYLWHRHLVQLGFAVASIDNRGTASPRGRDFRQSIYGKIGILTPQDQAAGAQRLLEQFPQLDPARIGVWGWSGGGSTTLNSLFRYPDLYAAGVAVAPVADQLDYDTIYQERYMGLIEDNRQRFIDGSPITHAEGLADPLLIIHGTADDNVHYGSTERLINRLVASGKQFRMIAYPGRSHSISEGEGTVMHLRQLITNFFIETLTPNQRADR